MLGWFRRRRDRHEREVEAVKAYVAELRNWDVEELRSMIPSQPGSWWIEELQTERSGVRVGVNMDTWLFQEDRTILTVVPDYGRRLHSVVVEGFAIQGGRVRALSDADWRHLNV